MKQKKFYKTFKFWITSLLALSATSIITSLALTSCVANDSANKSDIVINDQTQDQEVSVDDTQSVTLMIEATSNKGENLNYQWYVNKNNNIWSKIEGATNNTYTIPTSDLQSANGETIWQYKAEIYHNSDSTKKVESKPISVKIKPPIGGGSVPDKPNIPNPEPTPPTEDNNPNLPEDPSEPTPPSKPDTPSGTDNPSIVPSPDHIASEGIGARLPLDKRGIVTTKYDQEKWIGDNSLSIAIMAKPNVDGIRKAIDEFIKDKNYSASVNRMLNDLIGPIEKYSYDQFGTGWILDYSENKTSNLKDYYIATNMHVLNSYFEIFYTSNVYPNGGSDMPVNVGVRIPFNKNTISNLSVYISQPKYSTMDQKQNSKSYADKLETQWYKTNIDINNWKDNLIPIGAYNPNYQNGFGYTTPFDMELTWQGAEQNNSNLKQTLYFKSSENGKYLSNNPVTSNESIQKNVDDFSVFKISLNNSDFDKNHPQSSETDKKMFQNMKALFDTSPADDKTSKNSSYIKKLNKLLDITSSSSYSKEGVDDLFMFAESSQLTNSKTQISIGGYPLIQEAVKVEGQTKPKWEAYTTFNTNTLTGNNIIEYPPIYYPSREKMGINQYTYKGNIYKINWKGPNNYILKNVNLMKGSSGGVAIDQNYKISCINWGSFIQIDYFQGIKYVLDSSSSTGLYSSKDANSLIWKWVIYTQKNGKQTKLSQLFTQLKNCGYFNS